MGRLGVAELVVITFALGTVGGLWLRHDLQVIWNKLAREEVAVGSITYGLLILPLSQAIEFCVVSIMYPALSIRYKLIFLGTQALVIFFLSVGRAINIAFLFAIESAKMQWKF